MLCIEVIPCLVYITINNFRMNDLEGENYLIYKCCIDTEGGGVGCCTVHWARDNEGDWYKL